MNILLVNDDGYQAFGINLLYDLLSKKHHVVIVAPKEVMSAKSVSIVIGRSVEVVKINDHTFAMDATPSDCVSFGLSSLNTKFDLVISGCNHGLNVSYDTMYSGTVGACLEALTYGVPAIAISCDHNFDIIEKYFDEVIDYVIKNKLISNEYLLNINFPLGNTVEDIRLTHIHYRSRIEATYYINDGPNKYLATRDIKDTECTDIDSDVYAVYHHQVSITKIKKALD